MDPKIHYQPFIDKYSSILDYTQDHSDIPMEEYEEMCKSSLNYLSNVCLISKSLDKKFTLSSPFGDFNLLGFMDFLFNVSEMTVLFSIPVRMEALDVLTKFIRKIGNTGPDYFKARVSSYFTRFRCKIEPFRTPHREKYIEVLSKIAIDPPLQEQLHQIIEININHFQDLTILDQIAILSAIIELKAPKANTNSLLKNLFPSIKKTNNAKLTLLFYQALSHVYNKSQINIQKQIPILNKLVKFIKEAVDPSLINTASKCILTIMESCAEARQEGYNTLFNSLTDPNMNAGRDSVFLSLCKACANFKDRENVHDIFSYGYAHLQTNKYTSLKRVYKGICILGLAFPEYIKTIATFCRDSIEHSFNFPAIAFDVVIASIHASKPIPLKQLPDLFTETSPAKSDKINSDIHIILKNLSDLRIVPILSSLKLVDRDIGFIEVGEMYYVPQSPPAYQDTVVAYVMLLENFHECSMEFAQLFIEAVHDRSTQGRLQCNRKNLGEMLGNYYKVIYYLHFNACLSNPILLSYPEGMIALHEILDNEAALHLSSRV